MKILITVFCLLSLDHLNPQAQNLLVKHQKKKKDNIHKRQLVQLCRMHFVKVHICILKCIPINSRCLPAADIFNRNLQTKIHMDSGQCIIILSEWKTYLSGTKVIYKNYLISSYNIMKQIDGKRLCQCFLKQNPLGTA